MLSKPKPARHVASAALVCLGLAGAWWFGGAQASEPATVVPAPAIDAPADADTQTVVLAGGCFWGVQAVFQHTKGVTQVLSGYAGGSKETAQYNVVSSGRACPAEAEGVQIPFDPRQISYGAILQIYISVAHDPTQLNRQGPDEGPQYRSAVFYADPAQQSVAQAYIAQLDKAGTFKHPVVTQLTPLAGFYPAEAYHQDYATRHPTNPYIVYNDLPKVENLKRLFPERYREQPVLVTASNPT